MKRQLILSILSIFSFCISCNSDLIYNHIEKTDPLGWPYGQSLNYQWTITDTADWYSMVLKIEHIPNLNYLNAYIKCTTHFPDDSKKEQILSLELFDASGKPFGICSSSNCETEISLIAKTKFQFQGEYGLSIEQYGRDSMAMGIHSFELSVRKLTSK